MMTREMKVQLTPYGEGAVLMLTPELQEMLGGATIGDELLVENVPYGISLSVLKKDSATK